jgi:hypothetical protein
MMRPRRSRIQPQAESLRNSARSRPRAARLRQAASVEDVDYRATRGLDRALFLKLSACG